jgi:hypothetical protein
MVQEFARIMDEKLDRHTATIKEDIRTLKSTIEEEIPAIKEDIKLGEECEGICCHDFTSFQE